VSLEALDVSSNGLLALPQGLQHLQKLELLHAQGNQLTGVPSGITALTALTDLDLSTNQLQPGGLHAGVLAALTGLVSLRLADNAGLFTELAHCSRGEGGGGMANLMPRRAAQQQQAAWLDAWMVGPPQPPDAVTAASREGGVHSGSPAFGGGGCGGGAAGAPGQRLLQLRRLDVSGTSLAELPAWLSPSVTELRAARNRLQELPGSVCARLAGSLRALDLRHNPVQRVPSDITHLLQLQLLLLEGCPCACPEMGGGDACGGTAWEGVPAEGSAAWAAGWLAARKAGRPWPPRPGRWRLPAALLFVAGVPLAPRESSPSARQPAASQLRLRVQAGDTPAEAGAEAAATPTAQPTAAFGRGRRRAAVCSQPGGTE
jgi:hypothetical protein